MPNSTLPLAVREHEIALALGQASRHSLSVFITIGAMESRVRPRFERAAPAHWSARCHPASLRRQVDIAPAQPAQLGRAQPGEHRGHDQRRRGRPAAVEHARAARPWSGSRPALVVARLPHPDAAGGFCGRQPAPLCLACDLGRLGAPFLRRPSRDRPARSSSSTNASTRGAVSARQLLSAEQRPDVVATATGSPDRRALEAVDFAPLEPELGGLGRP